MHEKIYHYLEYDGKEQNRMGFLITFYWGWRHSRLLERILKIIRVMFA